MADEKCPKCEHLRHRFVRAEDAHRETIKVNDELKLRHVQMWNERDAACEALTEKEAEVERLQEENAEYRGALRDHERMVELAEAERDKLKEALVKARQCRYLPIDCPECGRARVYYDPVDEDAACDKCDHRWAFHDAAARQAAAGNKETADFPGKGRPDVVVGQAAAGGNPAERSIWEPPFQDEMKPGAGDGEKEPKDGH